MKTRLDYVTNSSSSSFLIVGVENECLIDKLMEAEGKEEVCCSYGREDGKVVNFYGFSSYADYAGIDIETLLETMTLKQIKEYFRALVKEKLKVDIELYNIDLHYGEVGEG